MAGFFKWLWRHWYIPAIALAGVLGWVLSGMRASPLAPVKRELDAIREGEAARKCMLEKSAKMANAVADLEYRRTLELLDEKQRKKAEELRSNPARRVRYLRRLSQRIGRYADDNDSESGRNGAL